MAKKPEHATVWVEIPEPIDVTEFCGKLTPEEAKKEAGLGPGDELDESTPMARCWSLSRAFMMFGLKHMPLEPESVDDNDRIQRVIKKLTFDPNTPVEMTQKDVTTTVVAMIQGFKTQVHVPELYALCLRLIRPLQCASDEPPKQAKPATKEESEAAA